MCVTSRLLVPCRALPAAEGENAPAQVGGDAPAAVWVLGPRKRGMSGVLAAITNKDGRTGLTPAKAPMPLKEAGENALPATPRALNL